MKNDTFCVNPYLNLTIHPSGSIKPCCMSVQSYRTDDGKETLNKASVKDFWKSKDRIDLINDLNNGVRVEACSNCWQEEEAGVKSKRIRDNEIYAERHVYYDMMPVVLDLSLGNLCNLKCRICSPVHSTPWLQEEAELWHPEDKKKYLEQERWIIAKDSFKNDNNLLWEDLLKMIKKVERLDFAGGEPFYVDKHWDIVKACVDAGVSRKQYIHYNTNSTIFPEKHVHLFDEFDTVDIQFSSDGVGKKFEYMRHPADFDNSESVIERFQERAANSAATFYLGSCLSVSAYNVFDIFETYEHYAEKGLRMYINYVHDASGVRVLPPAIREHVIKKLEKTQSKYNTVHWEREKQNTINLLKNAEYNEHAWEYFKMEVERRDKIRNETYSEVFPEFADIMRTEDVAR